MASPALISSLWLLACCCVSSGAPAWVRQSPDVSVPEGDTLTISCCWTLQAERFIVTWLKNGTVVKVLQKVNLSGSLETSDCLNLTLTEVSQEDSGSYRCRVLTELPAYRALEGSGTVVTVGGHRGSPAAAAPHQATVLRQVLGLILRSLPFLALILTFFCLNSAGASLALKDGGDEQREDTRRQEVE